MSQDTLNRQTSKRDLYFSHGFYSVKKEVKGTKINIILAGIKMLEIYQVFISMMMMTMTMA